MDRTVAVKLFGLLQFVILVVLIGAIYFYRRRQKENEEATMMRFDGLDPRQSVKRAPVHNSGSGPDPASSTPPPKIESAFPNWDKNTPAHEILNVHPQAGPDAVESAYKALLKRYHPDRFASWGKGYQTRAHHVILLLQDARDRMLGKK